RIARCCVCLLLGWHFRGRKRVTNYTLLLSLPGGTLRGGAGARSDYYQVESQGHGLCPNPPADRGGLPPCDERRLLPGVECQQRGLRAFARGRRDASDSCAGGWGEGRGNHRHGAFHPCVGTGDPCGRRSKGDGRRVLRSSRRAPEHGRVAGGGRLRYRVRTSRVSGSIRAPPSKSYTHRAVILAALSHGPCRIRRPLLAEDTAATIAGMAAF